MTNRGRTASWVLASAVALGVIGCAGRLGVPLRPEADLLSDELSPAVDVSTLAGLAALAAKDRICRAFVSPPSAPGKPEESAPAFGVHSYDPVPGERYYGTCMSDDHSTFCDASAEDLATVATLMARDPRLRMIADLPRVVGYIDQACGERNRAERSKPMHAWPQRNLARCTPAQPILIVHAIAIRWPLFDEKDERAEDWLRDCYLTNGSAYLRQHCDALKSYNAARRDEADRRRKGEFTPWDELQKKLHPVRVIDQYGFENYFCPEAGRP